MQTIQLRQGRRAAVAGRGERQDPAYGAPAPLWRRREPKREQAGYQWSSEGARRCRDRLAANVNALHPQAKARFAMRLLDARPGLPNPWARRLELYYGQPVPSALLLGLEPGPEAGCALCPAARGCPREGIDYRELSRAVTQAHRLGVRLFVAAGPVGSSCGRYWPELLDLALRNPASTFVVFAGGWALGEDAAAEAAASGNIAFVFPQRDGAAGRARPSEGAALSDGFEALRAAGAPFGFAAAVAPEAGGEAGWEAWLEGMLGKGYLFGLLYPRSQGGAGARGRFSPMPLFDLQEEVIFTDEASARLHLREGGSRTLLVHAVTPRLRSLTLLESIEAVVPGCGADAPKPACPLLLGCGSTREVAYALLTG
ncbi:MAG: hypothetical protein JW820_02265 [Spirochaetales bacterium]|nr:hypothetical protein [Spirochaetales bacterium]